MQHKVLPSLFLIFMLLSCGTLSKAKKNIIIVDSSQRGLSVYNQKNSEIGKTPFFYKMHPDYKKKFFTKDEHIIYRCPLNWSDSLIPNIIWLPILPLGPLLSLGLLSIDASRGEIFRCKDPLIFNKSTKTETEAPFTRPIKMAIIPPKWDRSPLQGQLFYDNWIKAQSQEMKNLFAKKEIYERLFDFQKINTEKMSPDDLDRPSLNEEGFKNNLTHLVLFSWTEQNGETTLTPHLYDIFSFQETQDSSLPLVPVTFKNKEVEYPWTSKFFLSLLPNTLSLDATAPTRITTDKRSQPVHQGKTLLPRLLSSFGASHILHPELYAPWDIGFFGRSNIGISSWESDDSNDRLSAQHLKLIYTVGPTIHTPFGAIGISLGGGVTYTSFHREYVKAQQSIDFVRAIHLEYYAFFAKKFYFFIQGENLEFLHSRFHTSTFTYTGFNEISIGIGHYIPEIKFLF